MRASTFAASIIFGAPALGQYMQSKPFNLVVESSDQSLNGKTFTTCHSGAAIESLCLLDNGNSKAVFHLNITEGAQPGPGGVDGILTWTLPIGTPIDSSMHFSVDPSTNVALTLFNPRDYDVQFVGFNDKDLMNIAAYLDNTVSPANGNSPRALYNWYVCETLYSRYKYNTLAWALGAGKPQNPLCKAVYVKRVYV